MGKKAILAAVLTLTPCAPGFAGQVHAAAKQPPRTKVLAVAREIMEQAHHCALITLGGDGQPQARAMDPFPPAEDMTVWLATSSATRKVAQLRANSRVTLFYFDPKSQGYVTLLGRAELVRDPAEKAAHWKEAWSSFYKDKSRGDDFVLIKVKPSRLEVVSYMRGLANDPQTWRPVTLELP